MSFQVKETKVVTEEANKFLVSPSMSVSAIGSAISKSPLKGGRTSQNKCETFRHVYSLISKVPNNIILVLAMDYQAQDGTCSDWATHFNSVTREHGNAKEYCFRFSVTEMRHDQQYRVNLCTMQHLLGSLNLHTLLTTNNDLADNAMCSSLEALTSSSMPISNLHDT